MTDLLAAALDYAAAGIHVFPARIVIVDGSKQVHPIGSWRDVSTTNADTLTRWFAADRRYATASLCIDCGKSGFVVVDPDEGPGKRGLANWAAVVAEQDIPVTPVRVRTPGGGEHWFYREHSRRIVGNDSSGKVAPDVDVRGLGGFVIAWPSEDARGAYGQPDIAALTTVPIVPDFVIERMTAREREQLDPEAGPESEYDPEADAGPAPPASPWDDPDLNARIFTMAQAIDDVRPYYYALCHAENGTINGKLNVAAKRISHFVPEFWSHREAVSFLLKALESTVYDGRTWRAEATIESAFRSAADDWKATRLPDPVADQAEEFWTAREGLAAVRDAARARLVSPWATLGAVLALVCSQVGPHVVLPPIIGGQASLNTFVALVGSSGAGKDAALAVARELLQIDDRVPTREVGTGQGIDAAYTTQTPKSGPVQYCDAALFTVTEIDTLASHAAMGGATVMPTLRKVYSGAALGAFYADKFKRRPVAAHAYRAALVAGVQPARSGTLLNDVDGGTPQRWIWLPTNDPGAAAEATEYEAPTFGIWARYEYLAPIGETSEDRPITRKRQVEIRVCDSARDIIIEARRTQLRGAVTGSGGLDGHALLTRLKVAALLGLFDGGRTEVTDEDWDLAGTVMQVSDRTRGACSAALADTSRKANVAKAMQEVERGHVVATQGERRIAAAVLRVLKRAGDWVPHSSLRKSLSAPDRPNFDMALEALRAAGQIDEEGSDRGNRYRFRD